MHSIYRFQLAILLLLALPLTPLVLWVPEQFPNWDDRSEMRIVDDRYVLVTRTSYPGSSAPWGDMVMRYFLLDRQTGRTRQLRTTGGPYKSRGSPYVIAPGRIIWMHHNHAWWAEVIEPSTNSVRIAHLPYDTVAPVGGRFLISIKAKSRFAWLDLQDPELKWQEQASQISDVHVLYNYERPRFFEFQKFRPNDDSTAKVNLDPSITQLSKLVLYRLDVDGPKEVASWPVNGDLSVHHDTLAEGPYIFCKSLDGKRLDVHSSSTGEVVSQIPVGAIVGPPATALRSGVSWWAHRFAVRIQGPSGPLLFDPSTGKVLPSEPASGSAPSRAGDRYLTMATTRPQGTVGNSVKWPLRLHVRQYPSGEGLSSYLLPSNISGSWEFDRPVSLSSNGQQVIVHTEDERILLLDALTGKVQQVIGVSLGLMIAQGIVVILLATWMAACVYSADRGGVPRVISMLVVSALWIGFMIARMEWSGHPDLRNRLALLVIMAILVSWSAELMQHVLRPGVGAWNRSASLVAYAASFYLILWSLKEPPERAEYFVLAEIFCVLFGMFYFLLRAIKRLPAYTNQVIKSQFSIGAMLILTSLAALSIAVFTRQAWYPLNYFLDSQHVFISLPTLAGLAALTLATRHVVWFRLLAIPATLTAAFLVRYYELSTTYSEWTWHISAFAACLSITSCFRVVPRAASQQRLADLPSHPLESRSVSTTSP